MIASAFVLACSPEQPKQAVDPVLDGRPTADVPTDGCRDWSALDRATLPPLPKSRFSDVFSAVWTTVLEKHFDPTLNCLDWPALRQEYGARVAEAKDVETAYAAINEMLGRLGQSHFQVISAEHVTDEQASGPAVCPLKVRWIDEAPIVVDAAVDEVESGVPRGAELRSIDGHPVRELVDAARVQARRPEEVAFLLGNRIAASLHGPEGHEHTIEYVAEPGGGPEVREVACVIPRGELVSLGNLRDLPTRVSSRMIEGTTVGYLSFNFWMLPLVKDVESRLAALREQGMRALVLDLRGNPGGVGAMSVPIARQFLREPGSLGTLRFRDFEQEFNVAGNPSAFDGPVAILVDEGTASTSEIFAAGMRDLGRATIIGARASAGAALPSLLERLEGGALLQYVVGDYHSPRGNIAEGTGINPDIKVEETRADFVAGRDPVLDAAVAHLSKQEPSHP
ncbi:MAG: hypothetical protein KC468_09075 [Myxococcales bacterium]|nr:hypothetical protein [Myxococcales bacterium]